MPFNKKPIDNFKFAKRSLTNTVLTEHMTSWQASEASETLLDYKYSIFPRGISINIAPKVGIFTEAKGRGKYSLPRVQYYRYSTRKG